MKKLLIALAFLLCVSSAQASITKTVSLVDTWAIVGTNSTLVGANATVNSNYQTVLTIDTALVTTTATTNGCRIIVMGAANTTTDNNWYPIATFNVLAGVTAVANTTWSNNNAGNTSLLLNTTTGFMYKGMPFYINDSTLANSEIRYVANYTAASAVILDSPLVNTHNAGAIAYGGNSTSSQVVAIPDGTYRIRVFYDNAQDAAGSAIAVRSSTSQMTGI
jgi:predicted nucleic acid-binding Zn ribbon protein